jgi:hypothetical protein
VSWLNVQVAEAIKVDGFMHGDLIGLGQRVFSLADLDGDFPVARRTDQLGMSRVENKGSGGTTQLLIVEVKPE